MIHLHQKEDLSLIGTVCTLINHIYVCTIAAAAAPSETVVTSNTTSPSLSNHYYFNYYLITITRDTPPIKGFNPMEYIKKEKSEDGEDKGNEDREKGDRNDDYGEES